MTKLNCPVCDTPHIRKTSDIYWVSCHQCKHLLAYDNKQLKDHGKAPQPPHAIPPFKLGVRGKLRGQAFEIIGRIHFQPTSLSAHNGWDNWLIRFEDGTVGIVINDDEGIYLYVQRQSLTEEIPDYASLQMGSKIEIEGYEAEVFETGTGIIVATEGQVPKHYEINRISQYVDCTFRTYFVNVEYSEAEKFVCFGTRLRHTELEINQ